MTLTRGDLVYLLAWSCHPCPCRVCRADKLYSCEVEWIHKGRLHVFCFFSWSLCGAEVRTKMAAKTMIPLVIVFSCTSTATTLPSLQQPWLQPFHLFFLLPGFPAVCLCQWSCRVAALGAVCSRCTVLQNTVQGIITKFSNVKQKKKTLTRLMFWRLKINSLHFFMIQFSSANCVFSCCWIHYCIRGFPLFSRQSLLVVQPQLTTALHNNYR